MKPSTQERIFAKTVVASGGCWNWIGKRDRLGYGRCWFNGHERLAHRVAYSALIGPIPDGKVIDHLCRNASCCNPHHLEAVDQAVNVLRGESPFAKRKRQTHCKRGHEFTAENTRRSRDGGRACRTCDTEIHLKRRRERYQPKHPYSRMGACAINARKTHCIHGHPLSGDNLYVTPSGGRACRACRKDADKRAKAARRRAIR